MTQALHIGFGNVVLVSRLVAMVVPDSLPVRRLIRESREAGTLVDATRGRKVKAVLIMDNGTIVTSALHPSTIVRRMEQAREVGDDAGS